MQLGLGIKISMGQLRFEPVKDRWTFYAVLEIGRHHVALMRWDTIRSPKNRLLTPDGLMGWTASYWRLLPKPATEENYKTYRKSLLPWLEAEVR